MVKEKLTAHETCQHWQQKRPPEGGLLAALIEAENQATRTPPPAELGTQPLESVYAGLLVLWSQKDSFHQRNLRNVARRTQYATSLAKGAVLSLVPIMP